MLSIASLLPTLESLTTELAMYRLKSPQGTVAPELSAVVVVVVAVETEAKQAGSSSLYSSKWNDNIISPIGDNIASLTSSTFRGYLRRISGSQATLCRC